MAIFTINITEPNPEIVGKNTQLKTSLTYTANIPFLLRSVIFNENALLESYEDYDYTFKDLVITDIQIPSQINTEVFIKENGTTLGNGIVPYTIDITDIIDFVSDLTLVFDNFEQIGTSLVKISFYITMLTPSLELVTSNITETKIYILG